MNNSNQLRDYLRGEVQYIKICVRCGAEFTCIAKNQQFCALECRQAGQREKDDRRSKYLEDKKLKELNLKMKQEENMIATESGIAELMFKKSLLVRPRC